MTPNDPTQPDTNAARPITPPQTLAQIEEELAKSRAQANPPPAAVPDPASAVPPTPTPTPAPTPTPQSVSPVSVPPGPLMPGVANAFAPDSQPVMSQPKRSLPTLPSFVPKKLLIIAGAILILLIVILFTFTGKATPDGTFQAMLNDALSTKAFEQSGQATGGATKATVDYDVHDVKSPIISGSFTTGTEPNVISLDSYYTFDTGLIKFNKLSTGDATTDKAIGPLEGKWIQTRKGGEDINGSSAATFGADLAPQNLLFGEWITGNFKGSDRKALTDWVIANKVYKYDSKATLKTTVNGHSVYGFDVTLNTAKLVQYNQKVAALMGLKTSDISSEVGTLTSNSAEKITLYGDIKTHHLDQMVIQNGTIINTVNYNKYKTAKVISEPTAKYTSTEFIQALEGAAQKAANN